MLSAKMGYPTLTKIVHHFRFQKVIMIQPHIQTSSTNRPGQICCSAVAEQSQNNSSVVLASVKQSSKVGKQSWQLFFWKQREKENPGGPTEFPFVTDKTRNEILTLPTAASAGLLPQQFPAKNHHSTTQPHSLLIQHYHSLRTEPGWCGVDYQDDSLQYNSN